MAHVLNGIERRLKERLVGAAILVALVVLIVPEFLRGPTPAGNSSAASAGAASHTITVDLRQGLPETSGGSAAPASGPIDRPPSTAAATGAAGAGATAGAGAGGAGATAGAGAGGAGATAGAGAGGAGATAGADAGGAGATAGAGAAAAGATHAQRAWSAQLGSFASRANADKLLHVLKGEGFAAYAVAGGSGASLRYRVRVGPLADRASAEVMVVKLKSAGYAAAPVAPGK